MKKSNFFKTTMTIVFFVLCWQLFIIISNQHISAESTSIEAFIPSPYTVFKTISTNWHILLTELGYTLFRAMFGLIIGIVLAVLANAIFFIKPGIKSFAMPISLAINSFPVIGFSPLIILTFGQGSWLGIVFISAMICYFPILTSLDKALSLNAKEFGELGKIWKASKLKIFINIQLPLVMPYVVGSLKMAIPASIVGATLGEWLGTNHGIGRLVVVSLYQLNPGLLYSSLLFLLISSLFITWLSTIIEKKAFPWLENN